MKSFRFIISLLFTALLMAAHPAGAFTTDRNSDTNANGSAKFSDPDEQFDDMTPSDGPPHSGILQFGDGSGLNSYLDVYPSDNYSDRTTSAIR